MKTFVLAILSVTFFANLFAQEPIYGQWAFQNNAVYIVINEDSSVFQCRIARDRSAIYAKGQLHSNAKPLINWEPVVIIDSEGNSINSERFNWGTDVLSLKEGELTLAGKYGEFTYHKNYDNLPMECYRYLNPTRSKLIIKGES